MILGGPDKLLKAKTVTNSGPAAAPDLQNVAVMIQDHALLKSRDMQQKAPQGL